MINGNGSFTNFWFVGSRHSFVILQSRTLNSLHPAIEGVELANEGSIIYYKKEKTEVDPCVVFLFIFSVLKSKS